MLAAALYSAHRLCNTPLLRADRRAATLRFARNEGGASK